MNERNRVMEEAEASREGSQEAMVEPMVMNSPACEGGGGDTPVGGR